MECWNTGIVEEINIGRDERLLVLGTQTRAPSRAYIQFPIIPTFRYSNFPFSSFTQGNSHDTPRLS
jgi:hypothetical protein